MSQPQAISQCWVEEVNKKQRTICVEEEGTSCKSFITSIPAQHK